MRAEGGGEEERAEGEPGFEVGGGLEGEGVEGVGGGRFVWEGRGFTREGREGWVGGGVFPRYGWGRGLWEFGLELGG